MRVFLDTNVVLDVALQRSPFAADSQRVLEICNEPGNSGYIAWHTLATGYYLLAKSLDHSTANSFFLDLLDQVDVGPVSTSMAKRAFVSGLKDSEDALQLVVAESLNADVIITRNEKDFAGSGISVVTPEEFVKT